MFAWKGSFVAVLFRSPKPRRCMHKPLHTTLQTKIQSLYLGQFMLDVTMVVYYHTLSWQWLRPHLSNQPQKCSNLSDTMHHTQLEVDIPRCRQHRSHRRLHLYPLFLTRLLAFNKPMRQLRYEGTFYIYSYYQASDTYIPSTYPVFVDDLLGQDTPPITWHNTIRKWTKANNKYWFYCRILSRPTVASIGS